jgi:non-ribosomal peptide synthetase component F
VLPEPELQFSHFARWQRRWISSDAADVQFTYWKEHLRDASPVFSMNCDRGDGLLAARVAQEPINLSNDLARRLRTLSHTKRATLFMTLLTGFKTLLLARTGRNDICVATAMANRSQLGIERLIGPVANITLIRTRIDPDLSFQEALRRVRDAVLGAYARQELPFSILATRLAKESDLDPASLIQVFFVLENAFRRPLKLADVAVRPFGYGEGQPIIPIDPSWLTVTLKETPSGIGGTWSCNNHCFEPNIEQPWIADYKAILAKAAEKPEASLGQLSGC